MTKDEEVTVVKVKLRFIGFTNEALDYLDSLWVRKVSTPSKRLYWWTRYCTTIEGMDAAEQRAHYTYWNAEAAKRK